MVKIKKYANVVERFLHGEKGQRFFNFAYSIGAAIVIWGALFKILHLPGGATLLCIGMGTEIAMFILTAFDRPPKEYQWEDVFPQLDHTSDAAPVDPSFYAQQGNAVNISQPVATGGYIPQGYSQGVSAGVTEIEEGAQFSPADGSFIPATPSYGPGGNNAFGLTEEETEQIHESVSKLASVSEQLESVATLSAATAACVEQLQGLADQLSQLQQANGYAEQMADLTRNISGLNTIYSIQLKSISSQLESIDSVNRGLKDIRDMYEKSANQSSRYCEETEKMARYMKQLNAVYEKMITAMTINMASPIISGHTDFQAPEPPVNPYSETQED